MKNLLLIMILFLPVLGMAQNVKLEKEQKSLKESGFRYLKAYDLNFDSKKEHVVSYVFSSNATYIVKVDKCDIMISIFDAENKLVASSYISQEKRCLNAIAVKCNKSGVYRIKYTHKPNTNTNSQEKNFISVIGFKAAATNPDFGIALSKM